jgi:hypothetical protein
MTTDKEITPFDLNVLRMAQSLVEEMYPGKNLGTLSREQYDAVRAEYNRRIS